MELSPEDALRLNVMLANAVAVRIDEGINTVLCLGENGSEAKVLLNPNCRSDQYCRYVRELLSSHVMGSPGGYPVYLKRWTRMGQASDARLDDLLMLGEKEAVIAVTGAAGLTDELARKAWWAMPDSDNARRMLSRESVVTGSMGSVLSDFLLEFLPFEESADDIIESVKLVLQPGLISEEEKTGIWNRGKQKNVFLVGFLHATPDDLPDKSNCRDDYETHAATLSELIASENGFAVLLMKLMSANGQSFLAASQKILNRPANQDVVVSFLEALGSYFADSRLTPFDYDSVEQIAQQVDHLFEGEASEMKLPDELKQLLEVCPELKQEIRAMAVLAHVGEPVIRPIFAVTDSVGSVMRKKIEPVSKPVIECLSCLQKGSL